LFMINNQTQQSSNAFTKALVKIGEKDRQALLKILTDLELLELIISEGDQVRKEDKLDIKPIITNKGKVMQLTSGQYRVWYKVNSAGILEYVKVFKKEKNGTPKRFKGSIPQMLKMTVPAEEVKVSVLLESLNGKNKEDTSN
jgi:mRNA-degrading endonuclease RelE of RelBE toxin-antitoxin system